MLGDTPRCRGTRNRAFIDVNADRFKIAAAVKICEACPLIQACARDALTAGDLQEDGTRAVADGVLQAGVICRGDQATVDALRAVAGLPNHPQAPRSRIIRSRGTIQEGQRCRECSRPLWKFTRDPSEIPDGYVMLYARGWCVHCRVAYKQATAQAPKRITRERQRRPRHCVDCDAPMVPYAHDLPTDRHVHHMARGRCMKCYNKARRGLKASH